MTQQKHSDYSIRLPWFGLPRLFPFMKPYKGIVLCMALLVLLIIVNRRTADNSQKA